jgi:hypothetical protein
MRCDQKNENECGFFCTKMVRKTNFYAAMLNHDAQAESIKNVVIFFNLMTAIEQKNPVIPLDHATILHQ